MSVELAKALKGLTDDLISSKKISDYEIATVIKIEEGKPVLQLDGSQGPLPKAAVSVPDYLSEYEVEITKGELDTTAEGVENGPLKLKDITGKITIDNSLKEQDKVYVLGKTGGQKFLVLGRIPKDASN